MNNEMEFDKVRWNIGKPLFEFDTGRYFLSTIYSQILLTLMVVRLYSKATLLTQIIIATIVFIVMCLSMWLFGWVLIKYKIMEKFQLENPSVKKMLGEVEKLGRGKTIKKTDVIIGEEA